MADPNIEILKEESYLKAIENSIGSRLFNSLIVCYKDSGRIVDILNDGEYSCAFFVSALLYLFDAIDKPHATVRRLLETLEKDEDWKAISIDTAKPGDVIFWEKIRFDDGSENEHVGFVLEKGEAVSTDYRKKLVGRHDLYFGASHRSIEAVYRYEWPHA
jgi:hypothetical protein